MCGLSKWHMGPFPSACYVSDQQGICSLSPSLVQLHCCVLSCLVAVFPVPPTPTWLHCELSAMSSLANHTVASQLCGAADSSPEKAAEQESQRKVLTLPGRREARVLVSCALCDAPAPLFPDCTDLGQAAKCTTVFSFVLPNWNQ